MKNVPQLKERAMSFLKLVAAGQVDEAYEKYVDSQFIHHNPHFNGDRESLRVAMKKDAEVHPNKIFDIKFAVEEGELVTVYSHVKQQPEDLGAALVHIFRFKDDQIVELWDVGQPVPEDSPNENGIF